MGREQMRAADADRQQVAERLRVALNEGRLDLDEYDERLQQAYAVKTYGELDRLLADLPAPASAARSQLVAPGPDPAPAPVRDARPDPDVTRRWVINVWEEYTGVVAICVAVWLFTGGGFWPMWVIGPWGVVLLVHTVTGLAKGEPQRWAAKQDRKRQAKERKRLAKERKRELGRGGGAVANGEQTP